jgi:hypothetical protein
LKNKSVIQYNEKYIEYEKRKQEEKDFVSPLIVLDGLVDLHFKRQEEYINNWGYNEYEKMFIDPNYDYEYFDKLDAKYEDEMEKLSDEEHESMNETFISNPEQFNNYWTH